MVYATQLDMEARFGAAELAQLTDRAEGSVIDAAVVVRAIEDAAAEIDGYLASRFALPLVATPEVLVRLNCDMARYYLHDDAVTDAVRNRYTDAVRLLRAIAGGDVRIDGAAPLAAATAGRLAEVTEPSRPLAFRGGL